MRRVLSLIILTLAVIIGSFATPPIKVACVGNSITYGLLVPNREKNAYPFRLAELLGQRYEVRNFGRPGATLLKKGHNPYCKSPEYTNALNYRPDIVVIHLGVNDTDPRNWPNYNDEFISDYVNLISSFKMVNANVRIIIANLSPLLPRHPRYRSGTKVWRNKARETIKQVAEITGVEIIDFGETLRDFPDLLSDGIHPDSTGSLMLARTAFKAITGNYGGLWLPEIYSDGMVLQRYKPITINGRANAGEKISLSITWPERRHSAATAETITDNCGKWSITIPPMAESEGLSMTVSNGIDSIEIADIAVGEVWLASGQSNMEFQLRNANSYLSDTATMNDRRLRLFDMKPRVITDNRRWTDDDLDAVDTLDYYLPSKWHRSNLKEASRFSAIAWYFGKTLCDSLQVPVGIISNAIGGSGAESWIDMETLEHEMPELLVNWRNNDYIQPWVQKRSIENAGNNHRHPYQPGYLFSTGIRSLGSFPIAGVIWYQGESNAHNIEVHGQLFKSLVDSWRKNWNQPQLPFIFTQLSSIDRASWPEFRNSQRLLAQSIPWTAMVVSSDLGDSLDVHPRHKKPVAMRLARQALRRVYSMNNITAEGPSPVDAQCDNHGNIVISFNNSDGLTTSDGKQPATFEISGHDGFYRPANAQITDDNHIIISNMGIKRPRYVRYGWQPFTHANLINSDSLPTSTFKIPVTESISCEPWINAGISAAFAGIASGQLLRAGGCNFPDNPMAPDATKKFYSGIYRLTNHNGVMETELIGNLPESIAYGASASTPEGLVIAGGITPKSAISEAWIIRVDSTGVAKCSPLPSLPVTIDNCYGVYADGKVYIAGGNTNDKPSNSLYALDMNNKENGWQKLEDFPGNPRTQPVLAASDAEGKMKLYMWGGFAGKGSNRDASLNTDGLCYDIEKNRWTPLPAPTGPDGIEVSLGGGTAVTLPDGRIYLSGGVNKDVFLDALRNQAPDYLSHPVAWYRFNDLGFIYNPRERKWDIYGRGPETARAGATAVLDVDGSAVIMGGEIKPRIRTADNLRITFGIIGH